MRKILSISSIWFQVALVVIYIGGYLYLKALCYSTEFVPADPWKTSQPTMRSKVTTWGRIELENIETLATWGISDLDNFRMKSIYRDPGLDLDLKYANFINAIYSPAQTIDARFSGWAVRFKTEQSDW